jgi:hypothetical protein
LPGLAEEGDGQGGEVNHGRGLAGGAEELGQGLGGDTRPVEVPDAGQRPDGGGELDDEGGSGVRSGAARISERASGTGSGGLAWWRVAVLAPLDLRGIRRCGTVRDSGRGF